jgi:hypothetical protein
MATGFLPLLFFEEWVPLRQSNRYWNVCRMLLPAQKVVREIVQLFTLGNRSSFQADSFNSLYSLLAEFITLFFPKDGQNYLGVEDPRLLYRRGSLCDNSLCSSYCGVVV